MASAKLNMKIGGTLIGVILGLFLGAESTPNTAITEWACNVNTYSQTDPYAFNVQYVLADLVHITPNTGYDYHTQSPSNTAICYGYASCGTIQAPLVSIDCAECLSAARASLEQICHAKIGGMVVMVDCFIRYENYWF